MKSVAGLLCCLLLIAAAGCSRPAKPANQIEVWHWMTDRQDALETLARRYEAKTGIKVKLDLFAPSDAYTQKVIAAAQADVLPDVYGILDKKDILASFIKAGYVADLTAAFNADNGAWASSLFAKAIDVNRFVPGNAEGIAPGIYGVPLDIGSEQLIYNRHLLKKAGITKAPATFPEWLAAVDALRRVGIAPFVSGFGELWLIDCFASNYAFNIMGEAKVLATFRGTVSYTDPDWIRVFGVFAALRDRGAFIDGIVTKGNKVAEQDFALERAAFAFNGAWSVNVYKLMNPGLNYGVAPLPALNPAAPMVSWGGAESSFVINKASANKDKAVAFVKWLTAREQQAFLSAQVNNLPVNRQAMADIPENLAAFAKAMESSTHPKVWPVSEDALVREAFLKGIQGIIIGETSPEAVARAVQQVKDRQMKKVKH
ncbi:MAG: extracellular solute-binding protein [Candidatus Omnitrophota bacterium]